LLAIASQTSDWTEVVSKHGVTVYQKSHESGNDFIKGEGIIKATPKAVKDLLSDINQRGKWDTFFDSGRVVQEIEPGKVYILHSVILNSNM
jgi:hypothetical protein